MTYDELTELISDAGREALLSAFAGTSRRVPVRHETLLKQVPGLTEVEAMAVCERAGGSVEYFPARTRILAAERDALIRAERTRGVSVRDIALAYNVCEGTVRNALNTPKEFLR